VAERRWVLAQRIMQIGRKRHGPEIPVADLQEVLDAMTARVNQSVRSTWHGGGELIDSDDVRWMGAQLAQITGESILPPRPAPDQPHRRARFRWQGYSPELTRTTVIDVLRDAVNGYCDLVKENFANFGGTLSLNSVLPVCVEGAIEMPEDDVDGTHSSLIYELKPDRATTGEAVTAVRLALLTDPRPGRYTHVFATAVDRKRTPFYRPVTRDTSLPTGQSRPATNLAYEWLAADLHAVGWLDQDLRFDDLHLQALGPPPGPRPCRLLRFIEHLHRQALNPQFDGDRPAMYAVVQAHPLVRHRAERLGVVDAVPGSDNACG
jgi:hypothetical protein